MFERKLFKYARFKIICKPCPNTANTLKPRKIVNRLPDIDMWIVCEDAYVEKAQKELTEHLKSIGMATSDVDPVQSVDDLEEVVKELQSGRKPKKFLPVDCHIIEYSKLKEIIARVPNELKKSIQTENAPYIPIHPISYRKVWQYDDEAYNFVYDYFSAFTPFGFSDELQSLLDTTRKKVACSYNDEQLLNFLLKSATEANYRRFSTEKLKEIFTMKMASWRAIEENVKDL